MRNGVSCVSARRRLGGLPVAVVAALLLLGGCSTMETIGSALNPFNWFGDKEPDYAAGETVVAQKPEASGVGAKADGKQPALGSVPDRPRRLSSSRAKAERKKLRDGLASDAENARHSDQALREQQPGAANPMTDIMRSPDRIAGPGGAATSYGTRLPAVPTVTVPSGGASAATRGDDALPPATAAAPSTQHASLTQRGSLRSVQVATIYFSDGATNLTSLDQQVVRQVAEVARRTGGVVRIIGHSSVGDPSADPTRREASNFRVSLKRANAVAAELQRHGVPTNQVQVSARGDSEPVYMETAATGAAGNRRAEVYLDYFEGT